MQYRFTIAYRSGFGAWGAGDTAEFDENTAAWLLRDVPGCIEPIEEAPSADEPETRAVEEAPSNRQVTSAKNRRGRGANGGN